MKGKDLPSYIHRRKRDGVLLFRKRYAGKIVEVRLETQFPEGKPVPTALHLERERLLNAPVPVAPGRNINAVIRYYHASPSYRELKPRTRDDYDKIIKYLGGKLGHLEPRRIERRHVISWRDQWAEAFTPHRANYTVRVLSILMEQAKDMGLLTKADENPCRGVKALKYEKRDRQPWPETKVAAFRKAYPYETRERLLFELCIGTGQRIGDVLKMRWSDIEDGGIKVQQGKTGKALWVPLTDHLSAALAAAERRALFILTKDMTKTRRPGPWAYRGASDAMRAARKAIGAEGYDIHALRYSAAVELVKSGCSDELVAAVTGQSLKMVEHYTRHVRQRVRATEAGNIRNSGLANRTEHK